MQLLKLKETESSLKLHRKAPIKDNSDDNNNNNDDSYSNDDNNKKQEVKWSISPLPG